MTDYVTRDEFAQLTTRVDIVEREVEGEKMVTRHVLTETRRNSDDLAAIKSRFDRVELKLDDLGRKIGGIAEDLNTKIAGVDGKVSGLAASLPRIVADTMREVLRERDGR